MAKASVDTPRRSLRQLLAGDAHLSASEYATLLGLTVLVAIITVLMISESVGRSPSRSAARPPTVSDGIRQIPPDAVDHAP